MQLRKVLFLFFIQVIKIVLKFRLFFNLNFFSTNIHNFKAVFHDSNTEKSGSLSFVEN